jgi:two-component system cell cycle sensor histidine kinase/response regulator CckA
VSESPPRVLVVDDEPFVVKIAQRVLEREGIEVLTAATGDEALALLSANPDIALILLDSSLPDMNAERVLELMRDRGSSTKVLLSSGFGAESLPNSEQFANVCGFLPKPYPVAQLAARVREVLSSR